MMREPRRPASRRELLISAGTCAASACLWSGAGLAQAPASASAQTAPAPWQSAIDAITGGAAVRDELITIEAPEIAENGNVVPFNVAVDSPMTEANYVKTLRIISTANPQPLVATFRFTPESGRAAVSCRIRLAASQPVVALAELSDGSFYAGNKLIKVTIGGCGG